VEHEPYEPTMTAFYQPPFQQPGFGKQPNPTDVPRLT